MDAIRGWIEREDPGARVVPIVLPAFTDSRTFRDAFPECVAYGFFPMRHTTLYEMWPLIHAPDERIDVRDLGVRDALLPRPDPGAARVSEPETPAPRRHGAAATGCSSTGPTSWAAAIRADDGSIRTASGPKPRAPKARRPRARRARASCGSARRWS